MEAKDILSIIKEPENLKVSDEISLKKLSTSYPYFQAIHALHLKVLKKEESFEFKKYLRSTALHTTNRSVLFDFINQFSKEQESALNAIRKNNEIFKEDFQHNDESQDINLQKRSFYEWLNLTKLKTLDQIEGKTIDKSSKSLEKNEIIDKFIKTNPKISPVSSGVLDLESSIKSMPSQQMMTETLANIYFEQKKYDKAKQAYNILILNNPKKSSFFADQIKKIQSLQENN